MKSIIPSLATRLLFTCILASPASHRPSHQVFKPHDSPCSSLFFFFLLHTYLLDSSLAHELGAGSTRPSLHIEASRTVEYPSGSSSGEFLIALLPVRRIFFHRGCSACWDSKKNTLPLAPPSHRFMFYVVDSPLYIDIVDQAYVHGRSPAPWSDV